MSISTPNLPTGTLIEIIGHSDAGGGLKNLVRMDMATFIATFITPSLVVGPFGIVADFLATATVLDANHNKLLVLPANGTQITATLDVPANLRSDFMVQLFNPPYTSAGAANTRRHRIIAQYEDFFLAPGQIAEFTKHGGYVIRKDPPVRWKVNNFTIYANSAATLTTFDGMVAGTGSAKKTLLASVNTIYNDIDNIGSNPMVVPVGAFGEAITLSGSIVAATLIYIEAAAAGTCSWSPGTTGTFCLLVGDAAAAIIRNLDFIRGTVANIAQVAVHQTGIVDIGDPNISAVSGVTFADPGTTGTAVSADHGGGTVNFDGTYTIKAGNYGVFCSIGGASSLTHTGGLANTITGTPTIGTFLQFAGSGSNGAFGSGVTWTGAVAAGCTKYLVSLNASLALGGAVPPGNIAGSATAGGQVTP